MVRDDRAKPFRSRIDEAERRAMPKPTRSGRLESWMALALMVLTLRAPGASARGQLPQSAGAAPGSPELLIGAPPRLVVGAVAAVELTVRTPGTDRQPLLLTPSVEGEAVRMVRGRLLRDDAVRADGSTLVFALPLSARRPGAALLRVSLLTYGCDPTACQEVRADASRMLQVNPR
jgi:hypothetical protein